MRLSKRGLLFGAAGVASGPLFPASGWARSPDVTEPRFITPDDPATIPPPPPPAPAREGFVDVEGAKLFYSDTGGPGEAIVLEHPGTGSALAFAYQQPAFASAGYRVVAYSRRGFHRSASSETPVQHRLVDDVTALVEALKIDRFHHVGVAGGGSTVMFYGLAHPGRVASALIACSRAGVSDEGYDAPLRGLLPPGWTRHAPPEVRELAPSYRFANPEGVRRWLEIHEGAGADEGTFGAYLTKHSVGWGAYRGFKPPLALVYGDADLYTPPAAGRVMVSQKPGVELTIVGEVGHAVQWEQPAIFNRIVLDFLSRHRTG